MARVERFSHPEMEAYTFECPGCRMEHMIYVDYTPEYEKKLKEGKFGTPKWGFNKNLDRPTFTPSLLCRWSYGPENVKKVCHSFITDGRIQFLPDCTHELKGQTVDLFEVKKDG